MRTICVACGVNFADFVGAVVCPRCFENKCTRGQCRCPPTEIHWEGKR